jgi:hypothetical protein
MPSSWPTETAAANLAADAVLVTYTEILLQRTHRLAINPPDEEIQHMFQRERREHDWVRVTVRLAECLPKRQRAEPPAVQLEPKGV